MSGTKKYFLAGDRVKISESYHWAKGVLGTIKEPQDQLKPWLEGWVGCSKEQTSLRGLRTIYWVEFDDPQIDNDGDGPYFAAEVDSEFLSIVTVS
jgi:hypothetical protein